MSVANFCTIIPKEKVADYEAKLFAAKLLMHAVGENRVDLAETARTAHYQSVELTFPTHKRKKSAEAEDATAAEVTEKTREFYVTVSSIDDGGFKITFTSIAERDVFTKAVNAATVSIEHA